MSEQSSLHRKEMPVIVKAPNGREHEYILQGRAAWLDAGRFSIYIVQDERFHGLRIEVHELGKEADNLPVDCAYGQPSRFQNNNPRFGLGGFDLQ